MKGLMINDIQLLKIVLFPNPKQYNFVVLPGSGMHKAVAKSTTASN
jgi:hypothetical protein